MNSSKRDIKSSWVLCKSKRNPGASYFFNILTRASVWNLEDLETLPITSSDAMDNWNVYPEPEYPPPEPSPPFWQSRPTFGQPVFGQVSFPKYNKMDSSWGQGSAASSPFANYMSAPEPQNWQGNFGQGFGQKWYQKDGMMTEKKIYEHKMARPSYAFENRMPNHYGIRSMEAQHMQKQSSFMKYRQPQSSDNFFTGNTQKTQFVKQPNFFQPQKPQNKMCDCMLSKSMENLNRINDTAPILIGNQNAAFRNQSYWSKSLESFMPEPQQQKNYGFPQNRLLSSKSFENLTDPNIMYQAHNQTDTFSNHFKMTSLNKQNRLTNSRSFENLSSQHLFDNNSGTKCNPSKNNYFSNFPKPPLNSTPKEKTLNLNPFRPRLNDQRTKPLNLKTANLKKIPKVCNQTVQTEFAQTENTQAKKTTINKWNIPGQEPCKVLQDGSVPAENVQNGNRLSETDLRHVLQARRRKNSAQSAPEDRPTEAKTVKTSYPKELVKKECQKRVTFDLGVEEYSITDAGDDCGDMPDTTINSTSNLNGIQVESSGADAVSAQYCVVPDIEVLLNEFALLEQFVQSEASYTLLVPRAVKRAVEAVSISSDPDRKRVINSRHVLRKLAEPVEYICVQTPETEGECTAYTDDSLLGCCLRAIEEGVAVVLVTNNEELRTKASELDILCYSSQDVIDDLNAAKPEDLFDDPNIPRTSSQNQFFREESRQNQFFLAHNVLVTVNQKMENLSLSSEDNKGKNDSDQVRKDHKMLDDFSGGKSYIKDGDAGRRHFVNGGTGNLNTSDRCENDSRNYNLKLYKSGIGTNYLENNDESFNMKQSVVGNVHFKNGGTGSFNFKDGGAGNSHLEENVTVSVHFKNGGTGSFRIQDGGTGKFNHKAPAVNFSTSNNIGGAGNAINKDGELKINCQVMEVTSTAKNKKREKNINIYNLKEHMKPFQVINKTMEERIKSRIDEWVCSFSQIMEFTLSHTLKQLSVPVCVGRGAASPYYELVSIAQRALAPHRTAHTLASALLDTRTHDPDGNICMKPDDFMKMLGYGTLLIKCLQSLDFKCPELEEGESLLEQLLYNLRASSEDSPPDTPPTAPHVVKDPSEAQEYLKSNLRGWQEQSGLKMDEADVQPSTKVVRTFGNKLGLVKLNSKDKTITDDTEIVKDTKDGEKETLTGPKLIKKLAIESTNLPPKMKEIDVEKREMVNKELSDMISNIIGDKKQNSDQNKIVDHNKKFNKAYDFKSVPKFTRSFKKTDVITDISDHNNATDLKNQQEVIDLKNLPKLSRTFNINKENVKTAKNDNKKETQAVFIANKQETKKFDLKIFPKLTRTFQNTLQKTDVKVKNETSKEKVEEKHSPVDLDALDYSEILTEEEDTVILETIPFDDREIITNGDTKCEMKYVSPDEASQISNKIQDNDNNNDESVNKKVITVKSYCENNRDFKLDEKNMYNFIKVSLATVGNTLKDVHVFLSTSFKDIQEELSEKRKQAMKEKTDLANQYMNEVIQHLKCMIERETNQPLSRSIVNGCKEASNDLRIVKYRAILTILLEQSRLIQGSAEILSEILHKDSQVVSSMTD